MNFPIILWIGATGTIRPQRDFFSFIIISGGWVTIFGSKVVDATISM